MRPPPSIAAVAVTATLVLGIATGERLDFATRHGAVLKPIAITTFLCALRARGPWKATAAIFGAVLLGFALGGDVANSLSWPASFDTPSAEVLIEGVLTDDPGGHPFATSALIETDHVGGVAVGRKVELRATERDALRLGVLRIGDQVSVRASLNPLAPDLIYDRRSGAAAVANDIVIEDFDPPTQLHHAAGAAVRHRIATGASRLEGADEQLLLGFLLGETRLIDKSTVESFRAAGLTHLLAVSGANVAFVLALVGPFMRRLPTAGRFALGVATVIVFAAATRFEPSVLRAAAMALVVMLARYSGRGVSPGRALAIAVLALLVHEPMLVHSLGFRLSVSATVGIVVLAKPIAAFVKWQSPLIDALAITLAAEVAVSPMLISEFGSVPLLAPVANLLAVPAAEPLTIYGMAAAVIVPSLPTRVGEVLMAPCGWMLAWVRGVARTVGEVGLTLDGRGFLAVLLLAVIVVECRRRLRAQPKNHARLVDFVSSQKVGSS